MARRTASSSLAAGRFEYLSIKLSISPWWRRVPKTMSEARPASRESRRADFEARASADHAPRSMASSAANAAVRAAAGFIF